MSTRTIAVDWTGAKEPVKNLWMAEACDGELTDVRAFETRNQLTEHLIETAQASADLVVGLDFAFSLPEWFLDGQRFDDHRQLWQHMSKDADRWLRPQSPFWDKRKPQIDGCELRKTEQDLASGAGRRPTSTFKLVGADQVGRGSLRGMEHLERPPPLARRSKTSP